MAVTLEYFPSPSFTLAVPIARDASGLMSLSTIVMSTSLLVPATPFVVWSIESFIVSLASPITSSSSAKTYTVTSVDPAGITTSLICGLNTDPTQVHPPRGSEYSVLDLS